MRKKLLIGILILLFAFSFVSCGESGIKDSTLSIEEWNDVKIACIPLYVNRNLYLGDIPLCYYNDELMIPISALGVSAPKSNKTTAFSINGIDAIYLPHIEAWYFSYEELDSNENYDCFFYVDDNEKQISIRTGKEEFDYQWTEARAIAHAMGCVNGTFATNSLEAFKENYEEGYKVFEVDFVLSDNGDLLCLYREDSFKGLFEDQLIEGKEPKSYTKEEYLQLKIYGKYTPLTIDQIVSLMQEYTDIYIVTDTKGRDETTERAEFNAIMESAKAADAEEVLDRFIPQIYSPEMYYLLMDMYDWKAVIYDCFYSEEEIFGFAYDNGIKAISLSQDSNMGYFLEHCKKYGIKTYTHTFNTEEDRKSLYKQGFYGIFTDLLSPDYSK